MTNQVTRANHDGQSFRSWLTAQTGRDDSIGDLARDVKSDPYRVTTPSALGRHLEVFDACPGAHEAVRKARAEWEATA